MILLVSIVGCNKNEVENADAVYLKLGTPTKQYDRFSYVMGFDLSVSIKVDSIPLDLTYFLKGFDDARKQIDTGFFSEIERRQHLEKIPQAMAALDPEMKILNKTPSVDLDGFKNLKKPKDFFDIFSYIMGFDLSMSTKFDSIPMNLDYFLKGFVDARGDVELINEDERLKILNDVNASLKDKDLARFERQEKEWEAKKGMYVELTEKLISENRAKDGVLVTKSGLQYKIIEEGHGAVPTTQNTVIMEYDIKLPDGKMIQSSDVMGEPLIVPVYNLIPGWQEALTLMKVGEKSEFVIPPDLAFGEEGADREVPPNTALILTVYLAEIE